MCNSTIYEDVLSEFNSEKIIKVRSLINKLLNLEKGRDELEKNTNNIIRHIALNLTREMNVKTECMRAILDLIHSTYSNYIYPFNLENEDFVRKYKDVCRSYSLEGRVIDISGIEYFGHAVCEEIFKDRIAKANITKVASNYDDTQDFFEDLKKMSITEILKLANFRNFVANTPNRIMWATWSQNLNQEDPFDFMQTRDLQANPPKLGSIYEVGLSLGLCYDKLITGECNNMLLLTYEVDGIDAHIPTIADAQGDKYFSPSLRGASHGWTDPTRQDLRNYYITRCLIPLGENNYNDQPRPEAVHKPMQMSRLSHIHELTISNSSQGCVF